MAEYTQKSNFLMYTTEERMGMNDTALSFFSWLALEDKERQEKYIHYREYYDGEHEVMLTDRQKAFLELKPHHDFSVNYCPLVVNELSRRLKVAGFDCEGQGGADGILWSWWQWARMDAKSKDVHSSAIRDGDTYLIVGWNSQTQRPEFHPNLAYNGDEGVKVHYNDEDNSILFASKRWRVQSEDGGFKHRVNLYYPDRIERYVSGGKKYDGVWRGFDEDGKGKVIDWTDREGNPLGVPVFHLGYNKNGFRWGQSILEAVIAPQNALNKSVVDLIAAADTTGFRVFWATGTDMIDEDGNDVKLHPGSFLTNSNPDVTFGHIPGEPLRPLIEVVDAFKITIAQVTETPLHLFQVSGQNASEGAQKQQEVGMVSKAEDTAVHFGNFWEDVMYFSRRLYNAFGDGDELSEDELITTIWGDFEVRDKTERRKAQAEIVQIYTNAGAGIEQAAKEAGLPIEEAKELARFSLPLGMTNNTGMAETNETTQE